MVRTLCPGIAAAGIDVQVVSVYASGLDDGGRAELRAPVHEIGRRGRGDLGYFPSVVRMLHTLRPDVLHAHVHTGQYAGRAAAILAGVPSIVLTVHGAEPGGPVRWAADRVLHARTDRFIVFAESQRRRYAQEQRVPLSRIAVIPNGVAPRAPRATRAELRARLGIPPGAFAFYHAARLAPEKNQRAALDATALVAADAPGAHLVIAGTGPLEAELRAHATAAGIADRVRFLGYRPDAADLFAAMDAFVYPSYRERMPMALGEAMLAGVAPVIAPWEGHEDVVTDGETAFVANGFDAPALAEAMLRAVRDPGRRERIAAAAAARSRATFSAGVMVARHVELYRLLAREHGR